MKTTASKQTSVCKTKPNQTKQTQAKMYIQIVTVVRCCSANNNLFCKYIYTNKIYVKLILNWLWNANSSWPDILSLYVGFVYTLYISLWQQSIEDMNDVNRLKYMSVKSLRQRMLNAHP